MNMKSGRLLGQISDPLSALFAPQLKRAQLKKARLKNVLLMLGTLSLLSGCQPAISTETANAVQAAPQVSVAEVISQKINGWDEFTGRLEAPQIVELRPRVSGYIDRVYFKEGSLVKADDVLFVIDTVPFEIALRHAEAALADAKSQVILAQSELQRGRKLRHKKAISEQELDNRIARERQTRAFVQMRAAELDNAKLQLGYCQVRAPISGRVSRAEITRGNYVTAGDSRLTTVVSTDKVYAYFDADEQTYLKYAKAQHQTADGIKAPVFMGLINEVGYPHSGTIDFIDNHVNFQTGTLRARAVFDNQLGEFTPGLFSRIKLIDNISHDGILIDDRAVGTDQTNRFVLLLTNDNKVVYRAVTLGKKIHGLRVITSGLAAGDSIVVNGLQRVQSGATVDPSTVAMTDDEVIARLKFDQSRIAWQRDKLTEIAVGEVRSAL